MTRVERPVVVSPSHRDVASLGWTMRTRDEQLPLENGVGRKGRCFLWSIPETRAVSWYDSAGVPDVLMLSIVENCESVGGCFVGDRRADRLVTTGEFGNNPAAGTSFGTDHLSINVCTMVICMCAVGNCRDSGENHGMVD